MIEQFSAKVQANAGVAHGPCPPEDAVTLACERVAELAQGTEVAVPAVDPLLEAYDVVHALRGVGLSLLEPDHPGWRERIAQSGVGVTGSLAAIAETGTVALGHGPGSPRAVSLVPDAHVCLVRVSTLRATFEDALPVAIAEGLPLNLVWVSGPSRSADIEKQITLGVHGPRTFEVVIVDDAGSGG